MCGKAVIIHRRNADILQSYLFILLHSFILYIAYTFKTVVHAYPAVRSKQKSTKYRIITEYLQSEKATLSLPQNKLTLKNR